MAFVPSPAPSIDPLLQHPKIDFDKPHGVGHQSKAMEVLCHYSEPGPVVPKAISYGAYCALVTRRFDGEVVFGGRPGWPLMRIERRRVDSNRRPKPTLSESSR
jgi:hypothetical protein